MAASSTRAAVLAAFASAVARAKEAFASLMQAFFSGPRFSSHCSFALADVVERLAAQQTAPGPVRLAAPAQGTAAEQTVPRGSLMSRSGLGSGGRPMPHQSWSTEPAPGHQIRPALISAPDRCVHAGVVLDQLLEAPW